MQFTATGHLNVRSAHKTTLEFTHDDYLTKRGDCILAINANFNLIIIQTEGFKNKIKITIEVDGETDELEAVYNPNFNHDQEMVIRTSDFIDERTLATKATKAAANIKRSIVEKLKNSDARATITITNVDE